MHKSNIFFRYTILNLLFFLVLIITITNLFIDASMEFETASYTYTQSFLSLSNFYALLFIICILFTRIHISLSYKSQHVLLSVLVTITGLIVWLTFNPEKPIDSYDIYYYANQWVLNGHPTGQYYAYYPYQFGLIYLVKTLIDLFQTENAVTTIFRILNLIGLLITANILLEFTRKLTQSKKCSFLFILFWTTFFSPYFLVTFMYGDIFGMTFGFLAVWLYTKYNPEFDSSIKA